MLVGRTGELDRLRGCLAEARAVALLGEAGIGKTALLRAAAAATGRAVFEGGGLAMLGSVSYLPLARALGREPPPGDHAAVAEFVADAVGDGVLIVDDLHWADADTHAVAAMLSGRIRILAALRRGDPGTSQARACVEEAGFELIEVHGLPYEDAIELLGARRPGLGRAEAERVADAAHGNPLLLEELSAGGEEAAPLRAVVAARVRRQSAEAQRAVARLALLGRPANRRELGEGVEELLEAGLAVERGGWVETRHWLIGEAAMADLSGTERQKLHAELAASVSDPCEAALHHSEAGEREAARKLALEAAEGAEHPGERARYLGIAARSSTGPAADPLRLEAAAALIDAGEHAAGKDLAAAVQSEDLDVRAEASLQTGRAFFLSNEREAGERSIEVGLELVRGTKSEVEVRLLVERAHCALLSDWGTDEASAFAAEAWTLAQETGFALAEAQYVHGVALYVQESRDCFEHCQAALDEARRSGDVRLEHKAAGAMISAAEAFGDPDSSRRLTDEMIERARALGLRGLEAEFRLYRAHLDVFHDGDYPGAIARMQELLTEPSLLGGYVDHLKGVLGLALGDVGRGAEARRLLETNTRDETPANRQFRLMTLAQIDWLERRPERALASAKAALAIDSASPNGHLAALPRAWAELELGLTPAPVRYEGAFPGLRAVARETEALARMAEPGGEEDAEELFATAADLWSVSELRSELRCLWAAGEAAVRAAAPDRGRERLLAAESRILEHGMAPLVGRVHQSLREIGVRRSAPRTVGTGILSAREAEVMALVAEGCRSAEIAAKLGIARSTVESQVRSAMQKLGAKTRRQAALLALGEEDAA